MKISANSNIFKLVSDEQPGIMGDLNQDGLVNVQDIVLNIKSMGIRMHSEGHKRILLEASGPGEITAGMIDTGHDIEII